MSSSTGFKSAGRTNPLSADYEQLQRAEVVKKYQQEVLDLQSKIAVLKAQVASLETTLVNAFSDRLKIVEQKETRANGLSADAERDRVALIQEKKDFEATKAVQKVENAKELSDIKVKIEASEVLLGLLRDETANRDSQEKRVNEYGARTEALEQQLSARKIILDGREKNIDEKISGIAGDIEKLNASRKAMREEEDVLSVSRSVNKNQMIEMADLHRRLDASKLASEEASEKLKTEIEQNKVLGQSLVEIANGNKEKEKRNIEKENELNIMEKDLKQKRMDLEEREARIKNLEKGGK